jgi:integrase
MGLGTTRPLAPRAIGATDRTAVLRHQWHDPRAPLVARRGTRGAPAYRRRGRVRRRFAPRQLRHAHAVEMAREGVPLIVIQRQLGHSNLGITSVYLQGIDSGEIIETVHARLAPMIPVSASLRL